MRLKILFSAIFGIQLMLMSVGCSSQTDRTISNANVNEFTQTASRTPQKKDGAMEKATFGGGCFWCVEAVFLQLEGVHAVKSGYMGGEVAIKGDGGKTYSIADAKPARFHAVSIFLNGKLQKPGEDYKLSGTQLVMNQPVTEKDEFYLVVDNPTYEQVCSSTSGHAEVIQIEYDPDVVSFDVLLQVFWKTHDPTTLNRQGNDVGPQYRSAVFYHNDEQKKKAETYKKKLNEAMAYPNPVVTEITKATKYYVAEDYHQNYFKNNPGSGYCRMLIPPKLEKLKQVFGDKLKK